MTDAAGAQVGNRSSGSTRLEGASRGFLARCAEGRSHSLLRASGSFCSSELLNKPVREARFSYSLKTKIIQNSSVNKEDLLGVVETKFN